ncbi:MAG: methylcobamide--CoM methyltransferase [Oscillospiraceae bacterium]|nr:methylcobamide--CoM methyltransferase [Oscillospiraceae bacterium]
MREPLTRREVIDVIERKSAKAKIPLVFHKWWGNGLQEKYSSSLEQMASAFPDDIFAVFYNCPGETVSSNSNPSYRWGYLDDYSSASKHSIGETAVLLPGWEYLPALLADFPNPNEPDSFAPVKDALPEAGGRYKLGCWWRLFHERLWSIRGMENLMLDYYDNMADLKEIGNKLLQYYKGIVDRYAVLGFDGIFTSDDLGHQSGPMMSPAIFEELYFPLYKEFCSYVHSKGMHVFLHSCGDNTLLMDYLIKAGIDVFHPVQKGCMDEAETIARFGNKISFLAGIDVQHLLPEGSRDDVREGIRELIDVMYKSEGGLMLAAGNGIMPDTPIENIEEMLIVD